MSDIQRQEIAIALYAFAGGFADAASFILFKAFTGHVTGNLILLALSMVQKSWHDVAIRGVAVICFLVCTTLGFSLSERPSKTKCLFWLQAALVLPVAAFPPFAWPASLFGIAALCCSLGLQNGIITSSLGISVHSTFLSGDFTSLLKSARSSAQTSPQASGEGNRKAHVLAHLLTGFMVGASFAALASLITRRWLMSLLLLPFLAAMLASPKQTETDGGHAAT